MTFEEWLQELSKWGSYSSYEDLFKSAYDAGVKHERDACVKLCDEHGSYGFPIAQEIIKRG
jgi:hypothetical protein